MQILGTTYTTKKELVKMLQNMNLGERITSYSERIYIGEKCFLLKRKTIRGRVLYAVANEIL